MLLLSVASFTTDMVNIIRSHVVLNQNPLPVKYLYCLIGWE